MKKFFSLFIAFILICSLTACGENEESLLIEDNETNTEEEIVEENTFEYIGEFLKEYENIEASDTSKFLGTVIVKVRPEEFQRTDIPIISKDSENAQTILSLAHLKEEWLDDYAISISLSNVRSYTVIIAKAKPLCEENMINAISQRAGDIAKIGTVYPDQGMVPDKYCDGPLDGDFFNYYAFIVCDNADEVYDEINRVLNNRDLTDIRIIPTLTESEREAIEVADMSAKKSEIDANLLELNVDVSNLNIIDSQI